MGRFLTSTEFVALVGDKEARQIAGNGLHNTEAGSTIVVEEIDAQIAFTDELIAGYVLARNGWLNGTDVADIPNLLKGLASDIVRYRLRDKNANKGQISETVETRFKDALKRLEDIQRGRLDLVRDQLDGVDQDPELQGGTHHGATISGPCPQSDRILAGY